MVKMHILFFSGRYISSSSLAFVRYVGAKAWFLYANYTKLATLYKFHFQQTIATGLSYHVNRLSLYFQRDIDNSKKIRLNYYGVK
jgi:hypothetical protein